MPGVLSATRRAVIGGFVAALLTASPAAAEAAPDSTQHKGHFNLVQKDLNGDGVRETVLIDLDKDGTADPNEQTFTCPAGINGIQTIKGKTGTTLVIQCKDVNNQSYSITVFVPK